MVKAYLPMQEMQRDTGSILWVQEDPTEEMTTYSNLQWATVQEELRRVKPN